jgi:hypothetical protein
VQLLDKASLDFIVALASRVAAIMLANITKCCYSTCTLNTGREGLAMEEHELDKHKRVWGVSGIALPASQHESLLTQSALQQRTCLLHAQSILHAQHCTVWLSVTRPAHIAGMTSAGERRRRYSDDARARRLAKRVHASEFRVRFGLWLQRVQERLHMVPSVSSTLAGLQVWSEYYFYDKQKLAVVSYATKQLQRVMRQSTTAQLSDMQVLSKWSESLTKDADQAADKLSQVHAHSSLAYYAHIYHMQYSHHSSAAVLLLLIHRHTEAFPAVHDWRSCYIV